MSTANTNLKRHIKTRHIEIWNENAGKYGWKNLDSQASTKSVASLDTPREEFDVEKFHQRLVNFIVADDQVRPFCALTA
jgi:replication initiation and membrane attachment protein DnaB